MVALSATAGSVVELADGRVEFPVWQRNWTGTIGGKPVEVRMRRVADRVTGDYCYQPCRAENRGRLQLQGTVAKDASVTLSELELAKPKTPQHETGTWKMPALGDNVAGTWASPNGARVLPIALTRSPTDLPFPYDIHLVATNAPEDDSRCVDSEVTEIRLYQGRRLMQTLKTQSEGTCGPFLPYVVDANFDGQPDLTIAQFLPAGPNIPHQTWLYDPKARRFVSAPQSLQDVTSPEFDPVHKVVWTGWRASCCEHGVTTYQWRGKELHEVESASSYMLPVLDHGQPRYCYVSPSYGDGGHIEFPDRVEQTNRGLALTVKDVKSCETTWALPERTRIDIWKRDASSGALQQVRTENVGWRRTETAVGTRYCPEVPFFDNGKIRRLVLKDDSQRCSESDPANE